jgi:thymidylate synthase (FAD)
MILDKGYVKLVRVNGSELDIVNAARLSYNVNKKSVDSKDIKLIDFLIREGHTSPLRHVGLSLKFKAPMMVARQHWRHIVGASTLEDGTPYSELSRRYVRGSHEFYEPDAWRGAPSNSKQGSSGVLDETTSSHLTELYQDFLEYANNLYERMIDLGVAPEQARIVIPANALYTKYLWTPSLQAAMSFVDLRSATDAQSEIQPYADAIEKIINDHFPNVYNSWKKLQS